MENYQKMYSTLFNAITDALAQIENQNYGDARSTLIAAQQKVEEMYIEFDKRRKAYEAQEADLEDEADMKMLEEAEKMVKRVKNN